MNAVTAYHRLLEDEQVANESCQRLHEGQREHGLYFGEHPLSVSLRPRLIPRKEYDAAVGASQALYSALCALEKALLKDADLRAQLDLDPEEEYLALVDPRTRSSSPSSRLDGFFSGTLRYVEYNAETPAGQAYSDNLSEVFELLPVMRRFRKKFKLRALPVRNRLFTTMLRSYRASGETKDKPRVAIVDWPGLPTVTEFEMFRDYFESRGVPTVICDPREMDYSGGKLWADGEPVDLVYRRVLTSELLAQGDQTRALRQAYVDGAVCVVNTFRSKLLHTKMSLALLSDDAYAQLYTPAHRKAIARHVPWTRKLRHGPTTKDGRSIPDLVDYVRDNRETLVLKPNDEYGGRGVVLGWTVDQHDWEQDLTVALHQSYVVQEAVAVPREQYPVALDGIEFLDFSVDMDPYLFDGRVSGCLTRLSSSALLNVTAGEGSVVPTYIVEGARG